MEQIPEQPQISIEGLSEKERKMLFLSVVNEEQQMLILESHQLSLLHFIETGETEHRTIRSGDKTMVFNMPTIKPDLELNFSGYKEYLATIIPSSKKIDFTEADIAEDYENVVLDAANFAIEAEEAAGDLVWNGETLPCPNCKSSGEMLTSCECKDGSISYTDVEEGITVSDASKDNEPLDDCGQCHGTGKKTIACPQCHSAKEIQRYPKLTLINEMTAETVQIELNLAKLIQKGELRVDVEETVSGIEVSPGSQYGWANVHVMVDIDSFITRKLEEIGIDEADSAYFNAGVASIPYSRNYKETFASWSLGLGDDEWKRIHRNEMDTEEDAALGFIVAAQKAIAHKYSLTGFTSDDLKKSFDERQAIASKFGRVIDESNLVIEKIENYRPLRPMHEALDDLIQAAESNNLKLGFQQSFYATGEVGPSFYLLDQNNNPVYKLSSDRDVRESIENAWTNLQRIINKLRDKYGL